MSNNVKSILGITSEKLIGRHLLRTDEQRELCRRLVSEHDDTEGYSISLPADSLNHLGGTQNVRCIVSALADSSSLFFLRVPGADGTIGPQSDRVAELEHRLWRIATEVQASGIFDSMGSMPDATRFPQLASLSTRQWEVLSRLLKGERVPSIASELYVSQSTVRNNLSSIFQKFGVHSQGELISLLVP